MMVAAVGKILENSLIREFDLAGNKVIMTNGGFNHQSKKVNYSVFKFKLEKNTHEILREGKGISLKVGSQNFPCMIQPNEGTKTKFITMVIELGDFKGSVVDRVKDISRYLDTVHIARRGSPIPQVSMGGVFGVTWSYRVSETATTSLHLNMSQTEVAGVRNYETDFTVKGGKRFMVVEGGDQPEQRFAVKVFFPGNRCDQKVAPSVAAAPAGQEPQAGMPGENGPVEVVEEVVLPPQQQTQPAGQLEATLDMSPTRVTTMCLMEEEVGDVRKRDLSVSPEQDRRQRYRAQSPSPGSHPSDAPPSDEEMVGSPHGTDDGRGASPQGSDDDGMEDPPQRRDFSAEKAREFAYNEAVASATQFMNDHQRRAFMTQYGIVDPRMSSSPDRATSHRERKREKRRSRGGRRPPDSTGSRYWPLH